MNLLIPLTLGVLGLAGGVGAGLALRPAPDITHADAPCGNVTETPVASSLDPLTEPAFVSLDHQFVIPVIEEGRVAALVVMSLTLEVDPSTQDAAQTRKPRLRDRFLHVMLDHANSGGFAGAFTSNGQLDRLKKALGETATAELGPGLRAVLLLDIVKQAA